MCNEDQSCFETGCTCDDYVSPSPSPPPPQTPAAVVHYPPGMPPVTPASCELAVINDLKSKLSTMINEQKQVNAQLQQMAFPKTNYPFAPPISPSPPPPPPELGACVKTYTSAMESLTRGPRRAAR